MKKVLLVLSIFALAFGAILASAQQDQLEVSPGEQAAIRVAHLSPDAPAVDISVNGVSVFTGLGYRDVSDYEVVPSGSVDIRIAAGGAEDAIIEAALTVEEGAYYTIAAMGFQANLEAMVFRDNLRAFPPSNGASVRFLHASPDAGAVDVALRDGEVLVENLNFGQASSYFFVLADTYNIDIRAAGTDTVAFGLDNVQVRAGHVYTHFVIGSTGDEVVGEETTEQPAPEGEAEQETQEDAAQPGAAPTTTAEQGGDQGAITITTSFTADDEVTITVTGPDDYSETFLAVEEQTLDRLAPGTYTVTVDAEGAEAQEVEVTAGETATVSIENAGAQPTEQPTEPETEPGEEEGDDTGGTTQRLPAQQETFAQSATAQRTLLHTFLHTLAFAVTAAAQTDQQETQEETQQETQQTDQQEAETVDPVPVQQPDVATDVATEETGTEQTQEQEADATTTEEAAEPQEGDEGVLTITVDANVADAEQVELIITGPGGFNETLTVTDQETIEGLEPGTYTVTVVEPRFEGQNVELQTEVEVRAGETATVSVPVTQETAPAETTPAAEEPAEEEPVAEEPAEGVAEEAAPAVAAPAAQEQTGEGSLEVLIEQSGITVAVTGPEGYNQRVTVSQTLVNLEPGTYTLMATGEGLEPTQQEVEVTGVETTTVVFDAETAAAPQPTEPATEPATEPEEPVTEPTEPAEVEPEPTPAEPEAAGLEVITTVDARMLGAVDDEAGQVGTEQDAVQDDVDGDTGGDTGGDDTGGDDTGGSN